MWRSITQRQVATSAWPDKSTFWCPYGISPRAYRVNRWHWCNVRPSPCTRRPARLPSVPLVAWWRPITRPERIPNERPLVGRSVVAKLLKFRDAKATGDAEKIVGAEASGVLRKNFYIDYCLRWKEKKMPLSKGYVIFAVLAPMEGLIWPSSSATATPFLKYPGRSARPRS